MNRVIVLAGNYRQFNQFLEEHGYTDSEYVYGDDRMREFLVKDVVVYGTFWDRSDASKLYEEALSRIRRPS